eukprot:g7033.t1
MSEDKRTKELNPQHSRKLLESFLTSTESQSQSCSTPSWESNPFLQQLARSVKTPADFEYIEGLLREDHRHNAVISTLHSMTSTGTINSSRGSEITLSGSANSTNGSVFSSMTSTMETTLSRKSRGICHGVLSETLHNDDDDNDDDLLSHGSDEASGMRCRESSRRRKSLEVEQLADANGDEELLHPKQSVPLKCVDVLRKFDGVWEFKKHPKSDITHLHRIINLEKSQIKKNLEQNSSFEIRVNKEAFSMRTEIVGLCNVDLPLSGATVAATRFDQYEGAMEVHAEETRVGLRMIYTWAHPLAGTRRDAFEVSSCGTELVVVGYITRRDGTNCKAK